MRVLMVADFYWPHVGGVEQHVRTLAHALCERGHTVAVATTRTAGLDENEWDGPVEVVRIRTATQAMPFLRHQVRPWAPPIPDPGAVRALRRVVAEQKPDVIHGHDWLARSLLPLGRDSPPLVTTLHYYTSTCPKKDLLRNGQPCPGPSLRRCLPCAGRHYGPITGTATTLGAFVGRRLESRETTAFVSVSEATARGNRVDACSNHAVVPNFLADVPQPEDVDDWLKQLPGEQFFLYVGDLRKVKGYDVLLSAYAAAGTTRPLVVIGKRWPDSPDTLPSNVRVFENWPNHAVRAAYARARAAIVPSVWAEPFGIVAIEAMSGGIPVVASATGGLRDIVDDQRTGLLVTPGSVVELTTAIRTLDTDDALVERLGRAATREAERYTADAIVPQIEAVYASVLERPKAGAG